ncbi:MAG: hypothetical protein V4757_17755 [Pseudomonadota bacterium]
MTTQEPSQLDAVLKGLGMGCAILALIMPGQVTSSQKRVPRTAAVVQLQNLPMHADFGHESVSEDVRHTANWAMHSRDAHGMPFVVVDKKNVTVHVFGPDGRLRGSTPVLLGSAVGDDSVHGIGEREISGILPHERTTPSGRFVSTPGRNAAGEDIVWVDYDAAVSMHRVRPKVAAEQRLERLASPTPDDNRISFGCINVPTRFYDAMIHPLLGRSKAVVYVLPETRPLREEFGSYDVPGAPATATALQSLPQSR